MGVFRRSDGRWQVNYRDQGNERQSQTFARGRKGKQKATAFFHDLMHKKSTGQPMRERWEQGTYIDELAQAWVDQLRSDGSAERWLNSWVNALNKHFIKRLCNKPADKIEQSEIMAIMTAVYGNRSVKTRRTYTSYLKTMFEFGVTHGMLSANPLQRWKCKKTPPRNSRLNVKDLRKIQACAKPHLAWAIEVFWNIPVRPNGPDAFELRFDHVDFGRGTVDVWHAKVGKRAIITCTGAFMQLLEERRHLHTTGHLIEYDPCFRDGRSKPQKVCSIKKSFARAVKDAGIPYHVVPYDIRHLWITTMLNKGIEPSTVAYMAGTSVEMIMKVYYEEHSADRQRAAEALPSLSMRLDRQPKVVSLGGVRTKKGSG